jgi:hypothetical protein
MRFLRSIQGLLRTVLAMLVLRAVAVQFFSQVGTPNFDGVNFFSFFTIVSNIFGAAVLLGVTFGMPWDPHVRDVLRGAATLALAIVGVVFALLLSNLDSQVIPWVNTVVHEVMPIGIVLDWCINPPRTAISRRDAAAWLVLPAAYLVYTLARGAAVHWYPYPFLNVDTIGYAGVAAYSAGILVFTILAAYALMAVGNALRARAYLGAVREVA